MYANVLVEHWLKVLDLGLCYDDSARVDINEYRAYSWMTFFQRLKHLTALTKAKRDQASFYWDMNNKSTAVLQLVSSCQVTYVLWISLGERMKTLVTTHMILYCLPRQYILLWKLICKAISHESIYVRVIAPQLRGIPVLCNFWPSSD